jgi:hypothetical protein
MPEIDKGISFNGFHLLLFIITCNLIMNNGSLFDYIGRYIMNMETQGLWFLLLHISVLYLILTNLTFEFGFRAAIKYKM